MSDPLDRSAYRVLVARLGSNTAADRHIAAELRRLADHIESGRWPKVFSCSLALVDGVDAQVKSQEFNADYSLNLSYPLGG